MARTGKTRADWIHAGQMLLIEGGIDAVRLARLTELLDVSTGSFYHHFTNLDACHAALASYYGSDQASVLFAEARRAAGEDPDRLLREASAIFGRGRMRQLNVAMRAWAHRDERARAAVRRYDVTLMQRLDEIFLALGFDDLAAKSRTLIMMGLASLDVEENLEPSFLARWGQIRELILGRGD